MYVDSPLKVLLTVDRDRFPRYLFAKGEEYLGLFFLPAQLPDGGYACKILYPVADGNEDWGFCSEAPTIEKALAIAKARGEAMLTNIMKDFCCNEK